MLTNWKYDAVYEEGKVYDFANLPFGVQSPSAQALEEAIAAGYMEAARSDDAEAQPLVPSPMFGGATVVPVVGASKGKQPKDAN